MKKKHFYSHLVSFEQIHMEFDNLNLSKEEREQLLDLAYDNLHLKILDTVFSHLDTQGKETFLTHIEGDDHDKTWQFLKEKIADIEEKIAKTANELLGEFLDDIVDVREKRSK